MQPSPPPVALFPSGRALVEAALRLTVTPSRARAAAQRLVPAGGDAGVPGGWHHPGSYVAAGLSADEAEPLRALPLLLRRVGDGRDRLTLLCVDTAGRLLREDMQALHPHETPVLVAGRAACSAAVAGAAAVLAVRTPADLDGPVPGDGDLYPALAGAMAANGLHLAGYLVVGRGGRIVSRR